MSLKIETNLPHSVKEMTYARNHHWIKLKDQDGNETTLLENGVVLYSCDACHTEWYSKERMSNLCPACGHKTIQARWTKPQIALIPEDQSDFEMPGK